MSGSGFTPGPWKVETLGHSLRVTKVEFDFDNDDIAIVGDMRNETDVATARLIAAAPELLEALQIARDYAAFAQAEAADLALIDAAIAKATGAHS